MRPEACLHICLIGDPGCGASAFLRAFRGPDGRPNAAIENPFKEVEVNGDRFCVRVMDNVGSPNFLTVRNAALSSAHAIMLCFAVDSPMSLMSLKERWAPLVWSQGAEAPIFVVGLKGDVRETDRQCVPPKECCRIADLIGAQEFLECSSVYPETVIHVIEDVFIGAAEFYALQWQLNPDLSIEEPSQSLTVNVQNAWEDEEPPYWIRHERQTVADDPRPLDDDCIKQNLSMLGRTPSRQHAYLKCDLNGLARTSIDVLRSFTHLQYVDVSNNHLHSLEPLGVLRCLLHLNASSNRLIRTDSFAAPESLEAVDFSYNFIGSLGHWGVHKYLHDLNLRGNFINKIGPGLAQNKELRTLDLSENHVKRIENLEGLHLRTLLLAQNRLTTLEGLCALSKLQVLNVRHNSITSIVALSAENVPRLRTLNMADNRLTRIDEVLGLGGFPLLHELVMLSNPVVDLPLFKSQILHRLPLLSFLDSQVVAPEDRVKSEVLYGKEVEDRKNIFEELLPKESFVDRRMVTEEEIVEMELLRFHGQGDVGPFGKTVVLDPLLETRTRLQDCKFRQRLAVARRGGETADFCNYAGPSSHVFLHDRDIPLVMEAALEGGVSRLLLGQACLSSACIMEIISILSSDPRRLRHIEISDCPAIGELEAELLNGFPYEGGYCLVAVDCGLSDAAFLRLRNDTDAARQARERHNAERQRTAAAIEQYLAKQESLEVFASQNCSCDTAPDPDEPLCHPAKWRPGLETEAVNAFKHFLEMNPEGLGEDGVVNLSDSITVSVGDPESRFVLHQQRIAMLEEWGCIFEVGTEEQFERFEEAEGEDCENRPVTGARMTTSGRPLPEVFLDAFGTVWQPNLDETSVADPGEQGKSPTENEPRTDDVGVSKSIDPQEANEYLYRSIGESNLLLAFMLASGVRPDGDVVSKLRKEKEEHERAWRERDARRNALADHAKSIYDNVLVHTGVASGMLIAHFSFLHAGGHKGVALPEGGCTLLAPSRFGLKLSSEQPRRPQRGRDVLDLIAEGHLSIESASGKGFGAGSLHLHLKNRRNQPIEIAIQRGTIFQHVDWQHRQNLLVSMTYLISLGAQQEMRKDLHAFCMNVSCACSNGNPMQLTEFYFDNAEVLEEQCRVWDYFEGCFGDQ